MNTSTVAQHTREIQEKSSTFRGNGTSTVRLPDGRTVTVEEAIAYDLAVLGGEATRRDGGYGGHRVIYPWLANGARICRNNNPCTVIGGAL